MPLDVLESWPGLLAVTSSFAQVLGLVLGLRGGKSVRIVAGWCLALLGLLAIVGVAVVVKSNETGCAYGVGCGWSTGWLIQATSGSLGGRGRRAKRSGCWA